MTSFFIYTRAARIFPKKKKNDKRFTLPVKIATETLFIAGGTVKK